MTTITIKTTCPVCNVDHDVQVEEPGYRNYIAGMHIQKALPNNTAEEREMLITGICGKCWDELFAEDDDPDESEDAIDLFNSYNEEE